MVANRYIDRSCLRGMNSPVRRLMEDYVPNSVFTIAPERAREFDTTLSDFALIYRPERRWVFCADPRRREIYVSRGAVELLWCAALAHFVFYYRIVQGKQVSKPTQIDPKADPKVRRALDLLRWALQCHFTGNDGDDWPQGLPAPELNPRDEAGQVANELCLVACGFLLHHELAHLRLRHRADVDDELSLAQEQEADAEAAEWVFGQIDPDSLMFNKRMLGASGALVTMTALGMYREKFGDTAHPFGGGTHPFSYDRLFSLLGRYPAASGHVAEWVAFVGLDLHLENSGRRLARRTFLNPADALGGLCDQLAGEAHAKLALLAAREAQARPKRPRQSTQTARRMRFSAVELADLIW